MFRILSFTLTFIFAIQCQAQNLKKTPDIEVMNFERFEPLLHKSNDTLYLVNFWATWCGPCRDELPVLKNLAKKYSSQKFRLVMVSLDFPNLLETRLKPFLRTNEMDARLILLNDPHQNNWIDKVDPGWSGEIPFSFLYKDSYHSSFSNSLKYNEIDSIINLKITHL